MIFIICLVQYYVFSHDIVLLISSVIVNRTRSSRFNANRLNFVHEKIILSMWILHQISHLAFH